MLKKERGGPKVETPAVKDHVGIVQHDLEEILEVWRFLFSKLGTARESPEYDEDNFNHLDTRVSHWAKETDEGDSFTEEPFIQKLTYGGHFQKWLPKLALANPERLLSLIIII